MGGKKARKPSVFWSSTKHPHSLTLIPRSTLYVEFFKMLNYYSIITTLVTRSSTVRKYRPLRAR
jgi:hypothetical protein